jgi:hypothetical protein
MIVAVILVGLPGLRGACRVVSASVVAGGLAGFGESAASIVQPRERNMSTFDFKRMKQT